MDPELRAHMRRMAEEVLAANPGANIDELNRLLDQRTAAYNRAPQPEMGGLSPEQASRLLYGGWDGETAAIVVRRDLTLEELSGSATLVNARIVMRAMQGDEGTRATAKGNLNRAFVMAVARQIRLDPLWQTQLTRKPSALNEADLPELINLRHTLRLAGLIRLARGWFHVTRKGASLLADDRAGELFALLFHTTFRKLNLAVFTPYEPEVPALQDTIAFSFYALHKLDAGWHVIPDIAEQLVLPSVRRLFAAEGLRDGLWWAVQGLVLRPLEGLGLVEREEAAWSGGQKTRETRVRKTPLYARALEFRL